MELVDRRWFVQVVKMDLTPIVGLPFPTRRPTPPLISSLTYIATSPPYNYFTVAADTATTITLPRHRRLSVCLFRLDDTNLPQKKKKNG